MRYISTLLNEPCKVSSRMPGRELAAFHKLLAERHWEEAVGQNLRLQFLCYCEEFKKWENDAVLSELDISLFICDFILNPSLSFKGSNMVHKQQLLQFVLPTNLVALHIWCFILPLEFVCEIPGLFQILTFNGILVTLGALFKSINTPR